MQADKIVQNCACQYTPILLFIANAKSILYAYTIYICKHTQIDFNKMSDTLHCILSTKQNNIIRSILLYIYVLYNFTKPLK